MKIEEQIKRAKFLFWNAVREGNSLVSLSLFDGLINQKIRIKELIDPETQLNPFHRAAQLGQLELVQHIVEKFPKIIDSQSPDGSTAAFLAIHNKHERVADYLFDHDASPAIKNKQGHNCFTLVQHEQSHPLNGIKDDYLLALNNGFIEVVRNEPFEEKEAIYWLNKGADVDTIIIDGFNSYTPLFYASAQNNEQLFNFLKDNGANTSHPCDVDGEQQTPLDQARKKGLIPFHTFAHDTTPLTRRSSAPYSQSVAIPYSDTGSTKHRHRRRHQNHTVFNLSSSASPSLSTTPNISASSSQSSSVNTSPNSSLRGSPVRPRLYPFLAKRTSHIIANEPNGVNVITTRLQTLSSNITKIVNSGTHCITITNNKVPEEMKIDLLSFQDDMKCLETTLGSIRNVIVTKGLIDDNSSATIIEIQELFTPMVRIILNTSNTLKGKIFPCPECGTHYSKLFEEIESFTRQATLLQEAMIALTDMEQPTMAKSL